MDARILDAARSLLADGGFPTLTVAAVAERAGIGRPTVYRRFENSTAIALAVLHADLAGAVDRARAAWDPDASPEDQLVGVGMEILRYYARNPGVSRAMLQLALFSDDAWQARLTEQLGGFLAWIASGMDAHRRRGTLEAHADTAVIAHAFFAAYITIAIAALRQGLPLHVQETLLRALVRQHLVGLVVPCGEAVTPGTG